MDDELALELDDDPLPTGLCAITNHAAATHGASAGSIPAGLRAAALSPCAALAVRRTGQSPPAKQPRLADRAASNVSAAAAPVAADPASVVELDMLAPANAAGLGALQRASARARAAGRSPATGPGQMQQRAPAAMTDTASATQRSAQGRACQPQPSFGRAEAAQPQERRQGLHGPLLVQHTTEGRLPAPGPEFLQGEAAAARASEQESQHERQQQQTQQPQASGPVQARTGQSADVQHSQPSRTQGCSHPQAARLPAGVPPWQGLGPSAPGPAPSMRGRSATRAPAAIQRLAQPQLHRHRPRADAASASAQVRSSVMACTMYPQDTGCLCRAILGSTPAKASPSEALCTIERAAHIAAHS